MPKVNSDSIPIIMLGLAGAFVFASLMSGGRFLNEAVIFFGYAIIAAYTKQIYKDVNSFSENKYTKEQQRNWRIHYLVQVSLFIAVLLITVYFPTVDKKCDFVLEDVKTYFNEYRGFSTGGITTVAWDFEGIVRNRSPRTQHLKAMIGKLYNEKGILVGEGYTEMGQDLDSNTAAPFKVNVQVSIHDTARWHYYKESSDFKPDIYPWFMTCK